MSQCTSVLHMCGYDPKQYAPKPNLIWDERCRFEAGHEGIHSTTDAHWGTIPFDRNLYSRGAIGPWRAGPGSYEDALRAKRLGDAYLAMIKAVDGIKPWIQDALFGEEW